MAQKIRRCANPKCREPLHRRNQEYCDNTCSTAARRQRLKDKAVAESVFTPSDLVSFDAQLAANLAKDYALSAINLQDLAKRHGTKGVVILPAASGVLVVFPATNQPWPSVMYSDDCPHYRVDWRQGMFAKWWQVPVDQSAISTDDDVVCFVNTIQGKDRLKHRDAIDDILTGPPRHCLFLTLRATRGASAAPPRPFWPKSGRGPRDDVHTGWRPIDGTPNEIRARQAAERTAKQIEASIDAEFHRNEFAISRRAAGYARRRYAR
jgi:hypothetical protein